MLTIGVTGGIGSGKTTVCRLLEAHGARVFYADAEAKRLMAEDSGLRADLVATFGPEAFDAEGRLNRAYLAAQVFGDSGRVARLNSLVHPRVRAAFGEAQTQARADGVWLLVKEAALIFESGGERGLDAVVVVDAPLETRLARVVERDGATVDAVRARVQHQLPPEDLRRRADYVIDNSGSAVHLERQVAALVETLKQQA